MFWSHILATGNTSNHLGEHPPFLQPVENFGRSGSSVYSEVHVCKILYLAEYCPPYSTSWGPFFCIAYFYGKSIALLKC